MSEPPEFTKCIHCKHLVEKPCNTSWKALCKNYLNNHLKTKTMRFLIIILASLLFTYEAQGQYTQPTEQTLKKAMYQSYDASQYYIIEKLPSGKFRRYRATFDGKSLINQGWRDYDRLFQACQGLRFYKNLKY